MKVVSFVIVVNFEKRWNLFANETGIVLDKIKVKNGAK